MAKYIAQIIITGAQVVGRAFARAIRQEMQASQEAARRLGNTKASRSEQISNLKHGLTLDEAKQILNIKDLDKEEVNKQFEFLFKANERGKGSFYIQSKIVRAKERLDHELVEKEVKEKPPKEEGSKT